MAPYDSMSQLGSTPPTSPKKPISIRPSKDIISDFLVVYFFVPFWITLFASTLKSFHENRDYSFLWQNDIDLLIFPAIFVVIALPLTYLRFASSNPSHFLHHYRVETKETFLDETRENMPSLFKIDILVNIILITVTNLSGIFDDRNLSQISTFAMFYQALLLLAIFDAGTYWGHRIAHEPKYYKYHKAHHRARNTVALSLIDIEIFDFFINNAPILLLPLLMYVTTGAMVYEVWIVGFAFMFAQGFIIHCDLCLISSKYSLGLFWGDTVRSHSTHHSQNKGHFAFVAPQIWDWICATDSL